MTPIYSLVLASLMTVSPPILTPTTAAEMPARAITAEPMADAAAISDFVVETTTRYAGL